MNKNAPYQPLKIPPDLSKFNVSVGTSGYYYNDWPGIFNPPKPSQAQLESFSDEENSDQDPLQFYQKYFSFVEINNTHYTEPTLPYFLDIESRSKESMLYSVKVHKSISHTNENEIAMGQEMMRRHITAVSPLIESGRFFSFLIQLDDQVYRTQKKLDFLLNVSSEALSKHVDVHIEFRHISWHDERVLTILKNAGIGICNTEIPHIPHAFPLKAYATTDKGYIRYHGLNLQNWHPDQGETTLSIKDRIAHRNKRYDYEYSEEELLQRIQGQITLLKKTSNTVIAFNNHFKAKAIRNALKNMNILFERMNVKEALPEVNKIPIIRGVL